MSEPQKAASKKRDKESLDTLIAYRQVFATEYGQKLLNDLTKRFMLRSSMSDNPVVMAFREGERNVVLTILAALNIDENEINERIQNVRKEN